MKNKIITTNNDHNSNIVFKLLCDFQINKYMNHNELKLYYN